MRLFNHSVVAVVLFIITGCAASSSSIVTDYDKGVDFDGYKTYYWANEFDENQNSSDKPLFYNSLIQKRLKNAIEEQMAQRGYRLDADTPDLLVNVSVQVGSDQQSRTISNSVPVGGYRPFYPGFGNNFGYFYGFNGTQRTTTTTKMEGGLVLELIDRSLRQLVWQGFAPEVLHTDTNDKREELRQAVDQLFTVYDERFPAGSTNE